MAKLKPPARNAEPQGYHLRVSPEVGASMVERAAQERRTVKAVVEAAWAAYLASETNPIK